MAACAQRDRLRAGGVAAAMAVLGLCLAWWNQGQTQYKGLYGRYRTLARFLAGNGEPPLLTYPSWGYPWLLSVLSAPEQTSLWLQVVLASVVLMLVRAELHRLDLPPRWVDVLCVAAFPWYALASLRLPDPWAASFCAIGAILLARGLRSGRIRLALAAGLAFGLALNVRSEGLGLLPAAATLAFVVAPHRARRDAPSWLCAGAVAVCLLLPWGFFRLHHGAPFGLTTTNSGMVLYNSLGFQGNAWGIVASDLLRSQEARERFGPDADPASPEASRWFRERALEAIAERPSEFARKVGHNFASSLKFGFYGIEMEPLLSEQDLLRYEVLKEQLKLLAGAKVNPLDVAGFRRAGVWDEEFSLLSVPWRIWAIAALPIVNAAFSSLYLLMLLASLGWVLWFDRRPLEEPFVRVMLGFAFANWGLLCLLQYEPRQANPLFLFGLPLVAIGAHGAWRRWQGGADARG